MTSIVVEQEKNFDILRNSTGGLLFLIKARMDEEMRPSLVYDGGEHALLHRNPNNIVILDFIHPTVQNDLRQAKTVLVVELQAQSIIREYDVPVQLVEQVSMPTQIDMEMLSE
ncbi:MAG: hypothetical protein IJY58_01145 [Alphaproteobacteria bacterium]|nr:hypothetical protein [Alphaproteobacteria bacterium]MBQ9089639.1 hypothetical protein [Alphaproteobacteria bacterium]